LRELNARGTTIILTTHYLEEAESLCRNIAIVEGGKVVAMESTEKLLGRRGSTLHVTLESPIGGLLPASIAARKAAYDATTRTLLFPETSPKSVAAILADVQAEGFTIEDVNFARSSLQDVFLDLVKH
jgi:ABC-2 type transport system ATP-binding protein